jgi:hypothetical protein
VLAGEDGEDEAPKEVKKGISFEGLAQLVTMGAGAPMLGDLKKVNFDKPEAEGGAALQFELEVRFSSPDRKRADRLLARTLPLLLFSCVL